MILSWKKSKQGSINKTECRVVKERDRPRPEREIGHVKI